MQKLTRSILLPKRNIIFKLLFGEVKNLRLLKAFLLCVLDLPAEKYADIQFINPELLPIDPGGKVGIVDILITTTDGEMIHVEMQVKNTGNMRERGPVYHSRIFGNQLKRGQDYEEVKQVISILITDYNLIPESPDFIHEFTYGDQKRNVELTDKSKIVSLELPKTDKLSHNDKLTMWLKFMRAEKEEDFEMIASLDSDIKEAYQELKHISEDDRTRLLYDLEIKQENDVKAREHYITTRATERGLKQGIEQGLQQGLQQGKWTHAITSAKNLLELGLTSEQIAASIDLPLETVQRLANGEELN